MNGIVYYISINLFVSYTEIILPTVEKTIKNNYDFVDNKAQTLYQANKKIPKRSWEYFRDDSEEERMKKDIMLTIEIKNMPVVEKERRK